MTDPADPNPNAQEAAIAFLSRGAAYGRPDETVTRIDTHASVIFLIADRAYKLKRAVRFSYLDYATVARREAMCRAEFTLNRRTAPQLYRGVHAVTRAPDGTLALDGAGTAIDWLIEMTQFPQAALFDRLAARGRLTPETMRDLADTVAAFHDAAEPCNAGPLRAVAMESLDNLQHTGAALDQDRIATLARQTEAALDGVAPSLAARPTRRCHGDLHLGNICLIDAKPVLFDGIEFNDAFTCIDPLYDLAFLLMDLDHRDRGDLASLVFNRYLDRTANDDALALLPLYLSVRAGVRAHVSVAALARQDGARGDLAAAASRYLDAALKFLAPGSPCLIAIG
ncbi:MAG TPA: phosphotransferase, partial [Stellaceae bacterium]